MLSIAMLDRPVRDVEACRSLTFPEEPEVSFPGFAEEAFAILDRLKVTPHIGQYRKEREGIQTYIKSPFRAYRDDLVVNWVLPNRLRLETEKNVFSRLLKNDFGAGGCHHHYWMAFYRPERKRLTDIQLSHSLRPQGFDVGLFVGGYGTSLLRQVQARIKAEPGFFTEEVNPLLQNGHTLAWARGSGINRVRETTDHPIDAVPEMLLRADAFWVRRFFAREDVLGWGGALVSRVLHEIQALWPLYRFLLQAERT